MAKRLQAKSQRERTQYHNYMRSHPSFDLTNSDGVAQLRGSDTPFRDYNLTDSERVSKVSFAAKAKMYQWDWKKVFFAILSVLAVPILVVILQWQFDMNSDVKLLGYRVDQLQEAANNANLNFVTQQVFDLSLNNVKTQLSMVLPDVDQIENRIVSLEEQLINLKASQAVEVFNTTEDNKTSN